MDTEPPIALRVEGARENETKNPRAPSPTEWHLSMRGAGRLVLVSEGVENGEPFTRSR